MFDYPLSVLVGQKTNGHLLRQNLFPAPRARGRTEFVRLEGIVSPLDSNKILSVCRNHAFAKNTGRGHGAFLSTDSTGPAVRTARLHARVSYFASGLRSAHLLGTTQFVAQLLRRDGRQGSDADRAP